MWFWIGIIWIIISLICFLVALWAREYFKGYTSFSLGDPTPKLLKRLSPNPFLHIDIIGLLCIVAIGFWWWKPMPTNSAYYKSPKKDELLVALSGPFCNLILGWLGVFIMMLAGKLLFGDPLIGIKNAWFNLILDFWRIFAIINLSLAIFHLLPLPFLDWSKIVKFFSYRAYWWLEKNSFPIMIWFLVIAILPGTSQLLSMFIFWILQFIFQIFVFMSGAVLL